MQYDDAMKNRLRRMEGQVRGVLKMMEEEKHCKDIVSQVSAIRSAADRLIAHIVAQNLEHCILDAKESGQGTKDYVKEAIELLVKSR